MIRIPIAGSETVPNQIFNEFQQFVRLQFFREVLGLWKKDREPCERIKDTNVLYSWQRTLIYAGSVQSQAIRLIY